MSGRFSVSSRTKRQASNLLPKRPTKAIAINLPLHGHTQGRATRPAELSRRVKAPLGIGVDVNPSSRTMPVGIVRSIAERSAFRLSYVALLFQRRKLSGSATGFPVFAFWCGPRPGILRHLRSGARLRELARQIPADEPARKEACPDKDSCYGYAM